MLHEHILPIRYPPVIDAYSFHANRCAFLYLDIYDPIVIINHIMLNFYPDDGWIEFNSDSYRVIGFTEREISRELQVVDLVNYLVDHLKMGLYVQLALDHFYIQDTEAYNQIHFCHDTALIFGCNCESKLFYMADNGINGKYKIYKIKFEEIE